MLLLVLARRLFFKPFSSCSADFLTSESYDRPPATAHGSAKSGQGDNRNGGRQINRNQQNDRKQQNDRNQQNGRKQQNSQDKDKGGVAKQAQQHGQTQLVCKNWTESGSCRFGDKCKFKHGP